MPRLVRFRRSHKPPGVRAQCLTVVYVLAACLPLTGCVAIGATLAGLGFTNQVNGIQYRTFTEPLDRVSQATVMAFKRMAFRLDTVKQTKTGELIRGAAADRKFEVELKALTENTTLMRAMAKNNIGVIVDSSIAQEIIRQAEKALAPELSKARNDSAVGKALNPES